jgi:hypothetical protein
MAKVFWDRKEVMMVEFMPEGTTLTLELYYETPKNLRMANQKKEARYADFRCSAPSRNCASAYSCSHSSIAGAFQLGVV